MKRWVVLLAALAMVVQGRGQEFINLDFESSSEMDALPGWRPNYGGGIGREGMLGHLGMSPWFMTGRNFSTLSGRYVAFTAGLEREGDWNAPFVETFISQTGTVPANAEIIQLVFSGPLRLELGDTVIPLLQLGRYLWVGDISEFAGKTVELKIINSSGRSQWPLEVDEISFGRVASSQSVLQDQSGVISRWSIGMPNFSAEQLSSGVLGPNWRVVAQADLDGNGFPDMVLINPVGALRIQLLDASGVMATVPLRPDRPVPYYWRLFGAADIDNNSSPEILFQHIEGHLAAWTMDGTNFVRSQFLNGAKPISGLQAIAAMDFDGDQVVDILFQNSSRQLIVSRGSEPSLQSRFQTFDKLKNGILMGTGWQVGSVVPRLLDDGSTGILFQNSDGRVAVWRMHGLSHISTVVLKDD